MVKDIMEFLAGQDPEVGAAVQAEYDRQRRNIELIASENFVSPAVLAAMGLLVLGGLFAGKYRAIFLAAVLLTREESETDN